MGILECWGSGAGPTQAASPPCSLRPPSSRGPGEPAGPLLLPAQWHEPGPRRGPCTRPPSRPIWGTPWGRELGGMMRKQTLTLQPQGRTFWGSPLPEPFDSQEPRGPTRQTASRRAVGTAVWIQPAPRGELRPTRVLGQVGAGRPAAGWRDRGPAPAGAGPRSPSLPLLVPQQGGGCWGRFLGFTGNGVGVSEKLGTQLRSHCQPAGLEATLLRPKAWGQEGAPPKGTGRGRAGLCLTWVASGTVGRSQVY